ncbi:MAG: competence protein ComK [Erysipelotrichales bacterium]|nr:competence protein ComK [Erysipelotrichales bacterium]
MNRNIVYLCRGYSYYQTKVMFDSGEYIIVDDDIESVLDAYLKCYGTSLSVSKRICNDVFNYTRILPVIVSVKHDKYFAVNGKLDDENIILFDVDKVIDTKVNGNMISLVFRNSTLEMSCSRSTFNLQYQRIEEMRRYYDKSNKFTTLFMSKLEEGKIPNE